jgi:predicted amino acid dehydrogenase
LQNAALLANPFGLAVVAIGVFTAAIVGTVNAYQDLQKEHQKFKIMTAEQSQIEAFTDGFDSLIQKMQQYGDQLNDSKKAQELVGKDVEDLTAQDLMAMAFALAGASAKEAYDMADTMVTESRRRYD